MKIKNCVNGAYDNYDIPTHFLLGADEKNPDKGPLSAGELKMKFEKLQSNLMAMVEKMQKTDGEHLFPSDYDNLKKKLLWEEIQNSNFFTRVVNIVGQKLSHHLLHMTGLAHAKKFKK